MLELIRQRKKGKDSTLKREEVKGIPSMLDVLKDLNQVKLRSVERYTLKTTVVYAYLNIVLCFRIVYFSCTVFSDHQGAARSGGDAVKASQHPLVTQLLSLLKH